MANPLEYQGPNSIYNPYIDSVVDPKNNGGSIGTGTGYANIDFLLSELEFLGREFLNLYNLCVLKMKNYTLLIDTSNETLVKSHEMSYPDDVTPDSISFEEYIYNFSASKATSSQYVNKYYENKIRGIYGTNALDIAHVARISYSEVKRIENFLEKYTGDIDDPSEFRTIEIFQDWAQNAKNLLTGFRSTFSSQGIAKIPNEEMAELTETRAKEFQGLFQSKLNVINASISDLLSQLYKDWDLVSDVFYDKILGPSLSFSLKVSRNVLNGVEQTKAPTLYREAQMSKVVFASQFQTALGDQIRRNHLYYDYLQRIQANLLQRDSYTQYLSQLSNKGTVIPNPFVTQLDDETTTIKESTNLLGSRDTLTYNENATSGHALLTDREDDTAHPQYVLKKGDLITGLLDIFGRLKLNGQELTSIFGVGSGGDAVVRSTSIDWTGVGPNELSTAINEYVPDNLEITGLREVSGGKIEFVVNFEIGNSNVQGYEFEVIEI